MIYEIVGVDINFGGLDRSQLSAFKEPRALFRAIRRRHARPRENTMKALFVEHCATSVTNNDNQNTNTLFLVPQVRYADSLGQ